MDSPIRLLGIVFVAWVHLRFRLAETLAAVAMATYNQRITGDPLVPPHLGYTYGYNPNPEFIFQADPGRGR